MSVEQIIFYILTITVAGAALALLAERIWAWQLGTFKRKESLEERVQRLTDSLYEATALISNIEAEINARSILVEQAQEKYEQYTQLAEIKQPEVDAIAQILRMELMKEGRISFWKGFAVNFIFFILGAVVSLAFSYLSK
jgi:hypothetical protein